MRVGFLLGSGNPVFGGVERHIIQLANGLIAAGHSAFVVMGAACPVDRVHGLDTSVEKVRVPDPDGASLPAFVGAAALAVRQRHPDILHSHLTYGLAAGVAAHSLTGAPLVHTEHFLVRRAEDRGLRGSLGAFLRGRCDALICVSEIVALHCPVAGHRPVRRVIYNGTTPVPNPGPRRPPTRMLYVGRLERDKRVEIALEIVRALRQEGYTLDVVGQGGMAARLRARARDLVGSGTVRFHGWQDDVHPFLAEAGALLQPAREGLGYAALEAAAHGVPVVAPVASGAAEVVGRTRYGALVEDDDRVDAWVAAVASLSRLPAEPQPLPSVFHSDYMVAATLALFGSLRTGYVA